MVPKGIVPKFVFVLILFGGGHGQFDFKHTPTAPPVAAVTVTVTVAFGRAGLNLIFRLLTTPVNVAVTEMLYTSTMQHFDPCGHFFGPIWDDAPNPNLPPKRPHVHVPVPLIADFEI